MLHVADVARSLRFYHLLGFETVDAEGAPARPGWARMHCEGGALMFLQAEEPLPPNFSPVMLVLYTPDLPALREHLIAGGLSVGPIRRPPYMPSGEIQLNDPDGNIVYVNHWGKAEHEDWEKRRAAKGYR